MDLSQYEMAYQRPEVAMSRIEAFVRGELSTNEIVLLMWDIVEAGVLPQLPYPFADCVSHLIRQNLLVVSPKYVVH